MDEHLSGTAIVTSDNGISLDFMKYYPLGVCRNSPENFPTDRLFTGQRLDDTGLYYYGARYYDATIGRFISPDTLVPDPANPQSFNRYSYCLNNPMKYIDPSGNFVLTTDSQLSKAWKALKPILNAISPDMVERLDKLNKAVIITWAPVEGQGSLCLGQGDIQVIFMSPSLKDMDQDQLIRRMAHEAVHADEGVFGTSIQEEVMAYQIEYKVGNGFNPDMMVGSRAEQMKDLDPYNREDRLFAKDILSRVPGLPGTIYRNMPEISLPNPYMFLAAFLTNSYRQGFYERYSEIYGSSTSVNSNTFNYPYDYYYYMMYSTMGGP